MNAAQALDALGRADLSPRGGGREVTFFCPTCQGAGSSRRRRKASINAETGAWTCFACSAKGSARGLLRLLGETTTTTTTPAPRATTERHAPDPEAVARWLRDLADLPERAAGLRAWARDVRGWPDAVADRVHDVHGLSWSPSYAPRPTWAGSARSRPVVFALADETGAAWTAEARAAQAPADPKAMRLPTRDADKGRGAFFGSVPEAVARLAAGEGPLLIVEGGPDYVAAAALGFVVVGAHGWQRLRAVARAILLRAEAQGVRPSRLRVVVVPHIGDHDAVGERGAAQAVAELDGKANVYVARVAETKGDLADLLRDHGADAVRQAIEGAARVTSAPVHVADAEASTMLAETLRAALSQGDSALPVLQVAAGAGKTTVALRELARRAAAGSSSVALAVSTLKLAEEKARELEHLIDAGEAFPVPVRVQRGQVAECQLVQHLPPDDDRRAGIVRGLGIIGRRACLGCPKSSEHGGTCAGWTPPSIPVGVVTVTTHATVAALAELPDLLVVDELPATVQQVTTTREHVISLSRGALAARRWREAHPAHGYLADCVVNALDDAADGRIDVVRLDLDAVADLLRAHAPDAEAAARDVLAEGDDSPWPSPSAVRAGAARHWPDLGAWTFVRAVAAAVIRADEGAKPRESRASASRDQVHAALGEGAWAVETRTPWALPEAGKGRGSVVALDATATESGAEWQAVAEAQGRELRLLPVDLIGERAQGVHYQTTRLSTRRLFTRSGASVAFFGDAVGALMNALMRACGETPCEVGILTHKPVADVVRWGVRLGVNPDAVAPMCLLPDDHHARAVADVVARLFGLGWRFVVGHYGADERASNAFTGCDVVALIGSPRPDLGATGADAGVLGLTPEALWRGRVRSAAAQGLSRGRHLRRAGVRLIYAADDVPPSLPSVTWTTEKATTAHALSGPAATGAARIVGELADRWGALDVDAVAELLKRVGLGVKATDARVKVVARALGWQRWPVKSRGAIGGRPRMVWAADAVAAAWGLDAVRVDLADLPALAAAVGVGLAVVADEVAAARAVVRADEGAKPRESRASAARALPTTQSAGVDRAGVAALDARGVARGDELMGQSDPLAPSRTSAIVADDLGVVDRGDARAGPRRAAGS